MVSICDVDFYRYVVGDLHVLISSVYVEFKVDSNEKRGPLVRLLVDQNIVKVLRK